MGFSAIDELIQYINDLYTMYQYCQKTCQYEKAAAIMDEIDRINYQVSLILL